MRFVLFLSLILVAAVCFGQETIQTPAPDQTSVQSQPQAQVLYMVPARRAFIPVAVPATVVVPKAVCTTCPNMTKAHFVPPHGTMRSGGVRGLLMGRVYRW